jgi:hypothetical protein
MFNNFHTEQTNKDSLHQNVAWKYNLIPINWMISITMFFSLNTKWAVGSSLSYYVLKYQKRWGLRVTSLHCTNLTHNINQKMLRLNTFVYYNFSILVCKAPDTKELFTQLLLDGVITNQSEAGILKQKNAKLRLILSIPITEIGHGSNFKLDNRPLKSAKCWHTKMFFFYTTVLYLAY